MTGGKLKQFFGANHTPGLGGMHPTGLQMNPWPKMSGMNPVAHHSGMIVQPPKMTGKLPSPRRLI